RGDMRDFTLPRRYRHVFIGFNSFSHNLTQEDQLATLRCCREHLEEGGLLGLVLFHPIAEKLAHFDGTPHVGIEYVSGPGEKTVVLDAITPDRVEQINRVRRRIERRNDAGAVLEAIDREFAIRYVYKPEME